MTIIIAVLMGMSDASWTVITYSVFRKIYREFNNAPLGFAIKDLLFGVFLAINAIIVSYITLHVWIVVMVVAIVARFLFVVVGLSDYIN